MIVWPGRPTPLGASWDGRATNVAVFAGDASTVELCLFDTAGNEQRVELPDRSGQVWHGEFPELLPGAHYGFRVDGHRRDGGDRWNPTKLLIDPAARAIVGEVSHGEWLSDESTDSAPYMPRSVVVDLGEFDWEDDRRPDVPWHETVIYEAHVKGLTMMHPGVPHEHRGTYLGVSSPAVIDHLRSLGVTAIELLPVHRFVSEPRLDELGLTNYWGYNSIGYFAPHHAYAPDRDGLVAVDDFRAMVRQLHRAGIEVILDVVYNHTAEGGPAGPTLAFRGVDNTAYYRLDGDDREGYVDFTGCGNTLDLRHPNVLQLVTDSLRYWVTEMHVDGFRFDLATALARSSDDYDRFSSFFSVIEQDPILSGVKLIAEPWDVAPGGYQVGNFPPLWSEWNGRYRDTVRDFWRGAPGSLGDLAERLCGSSDLYDREGRQPRATVNFVTAHDGFTLADLTTYEHKRNEANGEDNRDGTDDNRSWNCGVEGPTDDAAINRLRDRQRRNLIATLLLSQGVPMLLAGDEMANTQQGSNNGYAQDNEISWLDWAAMDESLLEFTRRISSFRRAHPVLRRRRFFEGRPSGPSGRDDIAWFGPSGTSMDAEHWQLESPRAFGCMLNGAAISESGPEGERIIDDSLFIILSGESDAQEFTLPSDGWESSWSVALDTASSEREPMRLHRAGEAITIEGRSIVVLVAAG